MLVVTLISSAIFAFAAVFTSVQTPSRKMTATDRLKASGVI